MRIAFVHSYYSSRKPSGENVAVDLQAAALEAAGHEVVVVAQHTDDHLRRRSFPLTAAVTTMTGIGHDPTQALREFEPDVVHVHNLFPTIGTRWLQAWDGPLVATVHNFRPICAAGTLYRDGAVCTLCPDGDRLAGIRHGCFQGSSVATVPLAVRNRRGPGHDPVLRRADRIVVLSEQSRTLYQRYGVDRDRLVVVPNCVPEPGRRPASPLDDAWVFAGRLSEEKGILELLRSWPADHRLDVIGDGPLRASCEQAAPPGVRLVGPLPRPEVVSALATAPGLVFPSRCLECAPMVVVEALSVGTPVVALAGNAAADVIAAHRCGEVVSLDGDWDAALQSVLDRSRELRVAARQVYEKQFSVATWVDRMEQHYREVVAVRAPAGSSEWVAPVATGPE